MARRSFTKVEYFPGTWYYYYDQANNWKLGWEEISTVPVRHGGDEIRILLLLLNLLRFTRLSTSTDRCHGLRNKIQYIRSR